MRSDDADFLQHELPVGTPPLPYPNEVIDRQAVYSEPIVHETAWVAGSADVVGRVRIGRHSSVWYQCVLRGDSQSIEIGEETNLQDGSILHVDRDADCRIGNRVSLGHRALVHASVVEDEALIGMSATVLSKCVVGHGAIIAAGALVLEGTTVPSGTIWAGVPARQIGETTPEHRRRIKHTWQHYVNAAVVAKQRWPEP